MQEFDKFLAKAFGSVLGILLLGLFAIFVISGPIALVIGSVALHKANNPETPATLHMQDLRISNIESSIFQCECANYTHLDLPQAITTQGINMMDDHTTEMADPIE